jgi:hypothetical protein
LTGVNHSFVVAVVLLLASAIGVGSVYANLSVDTPPHLLYWIWIFYAPVWFVFNALFGGIHGAPQWSIIPSVLLTVVSQNALLYFASRWVMKWVARSRQRASSKVWR